MPLKREKVAAYHRARRARIKAEKEVIAEGGRPIFTTHSHGDVGYRNGNKPKPPRTEPLRQPTADRYARTALGAVASSAAPQRFADRSRSGSPVASTLPTVYHPPSTAYRPPATAYSPPSTFASGGRPPAGPLRSSIAEATNDLRTQLAMHARAIEELTLRDREKERRIAALEAERRAEKPTFAQALFLAVCSLGR
jgi:hypothetical protein